MTKLLVFPLVLLLTRNPWAAALVTLAVWLVADWNAFQLVPRFGRRLRDLQRAFELSRALRVNPHDRRARVELADVDNRLGRHRAAVDGVKPAVEADPNDLEALYQLGVACLRLGDVARGEVFLAEVESQRAGFHQGEVHFEIARARLAAGDPKGALEAAGRFLAVHAGSVRGLVLAAEAHEALGEAPAAREARARAWREFVELPRFAKRQARAWAWRAKPSRPIAYVGVAALLISILWSAPRFL